MGSEMCIRDRGIGVNAAFRTLSSWEGLLRGVRRRGGRAALRDGAAAAELLRAYAAAMEASAADQANRQLATIYLEAVCGFLTFADGRAYRRRRADRSLHEMPLDALRNLNCTAEATAKSRARGNR